ncbi:MAG: hypothetical protein ACRDD1_01415, partial [Planctomycetia bacterium]
AKFLDCEFADVADFRSLHCDSGVDVQRCRFLGDFLGRGATVSKKLDLTGSRFEGMLDLSKAKLHDFAYLEQIETGPKFEFACRNAVADRLLIRSEQLEGRMRNECKKDARAAMEEYGLLKRNFESLHRYGDEDWAFYRFKINQRRAAPRSWKRPWTKLAQFADWLLLDVGCGYGTNPLRAVRAAFVIIVFFAVVYSIGYGHFTVGNPPVEGLPADAWPNRLLFSTLTSISVFTSGFTSGQLATASGWVLAPLAVEALLGTLLWGLFIVAFSRKVIR